MGKGIMIKGRQAMLITESITEKRSTKCYATGTLCAIFEVSRVDIEESMTKNL